MKSYVTLFLIFVLSIPTFAGRVNRRQMRQNARTAEGVKNGSLTRKEVKQLNRSRRKIQRAENQAKSDGKVTKKERARLENMQDARSQQIKRLKHNDRTQSE